jgi:flagellin
MPLRINLNANSLFAQTNLAVKQRAMSTALERLSSGLRINHSSDDAAGFLLSLQMQFQIVGVDAGTNNLSMAIDLLNTADSYTRTISDDMTRMVDLASQAKNQLLTGNQRTALNFEFQELLDEIQRLTTNATYNGRTLLDGGLNGVTVQTGASNGDIVIVSIGTMTTGAVAGLGISMLSIGTFTAAMSAISMINSAVNIILSPNVASIGAQAAGWLKSVDAQQMYSTNLKAARSRIVDADIAVETTNMTNAQVVVQSGIAALAQANSAQTLALGLIGK